MAKDLPPYIGLFELLVTCATVFTAQKRITGSVTNRSSIAVLSTARWMLLFFALLILASGLALGQSSPTTASIAGVVRDTAGDSVPNASVFLRDLATNQKRTTVTDAAGSYKIAALAVATYEVRIESPGFAVYINPQITLLLGQTTTLDITLKPQEVSAAIEVIDKPLVIDTSQTASTTSITQESIEELPVKSRNYLQFTLLAPGVAPSNTQTATGAGNISNSPLSDSGFTFGGLRARSNSITIDGLNNTDEATGASLVVLSPEIVREFQIINNGISAEFGGAAGGTINVITKTGSNNFHGTAFTFIQNEHLNARPPNSTTSNRPAFRRYQPGGSLGGPLMRDKLFFYIAAEQEHFGGEDRSDVDALVDERINTALRSGFAPRLAVRSLNGELFQIGSDETEAAGKLTYFINPFNTVNVRFAFTNNRSRSQAFNTDTRKDPSARGSIYSRDYQATGSLISVLTPTVINDLRFQFSSRRFLSRSGDPTGPEIDIIGSVQFGRPYDGDSRRHEVRQEAVDTISFTRGTHEWKTGANVNHVSLDSDMRDGFSGIYTFRSVDDFLAGRPAFWRQAFGASRTNLGVTAFGTFLQDRWQISPQLTISLGLRYEVEKLPGIFRPDKNNFSPRFGLAWSPSKEWVFRGGFGIFYDRLPLAFLNPAIQKNGSQAFEQVAYDSAASQIFAVNGGGTVPAPVLNISPSIYSPDPHFNTPHSMQTFAGVERTIAAETTIRAEFLYTRGINLPRTRNINLREPVVLTAANAAMLGVPNPTFQQLGRPVFGTERLDARYDAVYALENSARSTYRGMSLAVNRRFSKEVTALASYTVSKVTDDASDFNEQPANPYDLRSERAPSLLDVRHRFVLSGVFEIPVGDDESKIKAAKENLLQEVFGNIEIAPIVTLSSGRPVNALTGDDEERSRAFPTVSRPLGLSRNILRTPGFFNTDLRVVKYVPLSKTSKLDLAFEFFNLFNRPNVAAIDQFFGSGRSPLSTFRSPVLYNSPRQFRFSIDLEF